MSNPMLFQDKATSIPLLSYLIKPILLTSVAVRSRRDTSTSLCPLSSQWEGEQLQLKVAIKNIIIMCHANDHVST